MLTNETSILLFTVYCFLLPAPATTFSLCFGKQSLNVVAGAGTRVLFFYSEYFGRLLSCKERSEISQQECILWDAHLMKLCIQCKICVYFTQDARQNESLRVSVLTIKSKSVTLRLPTLYRNWLIFTCKAPFFKNPKVLSLTTPLSSFYKIFNYM